MKFFPTAFAGLLLLGASAPAPLAAAGKKLAAIKKSDFKRLAPHPRLILTEKRLADIKKAVQTDTRLAWKVAVLRKDAEALLKVTPSARVLIGPRLLAVSRETFKRVYTLGLIYRLEGDERFLARAKEELLAVAAFGDWNPSHFLDVAEMSHAVAIGYDWFFDRWTPEEKAVLRKALVEKGLKEVLPLYAEEGWQVTADHNWNQVCNGGLGIASLCLADEEPELALKILGEGLRFLPNALRSYGTDGAWTEGPSYWHFATRYTLYFLDALKTALGRDFGISTFEGLKKAGDFFMFSVGPGRRAFNYADAKEHLGPSHAMPYLAGLYQRPLYNVANERGFTEEHVDPFSVLWHQPEAKRLSLDREPLDAMFHSAETVFFRSTWASDEALFVGFKGGDNTANHGHLDIGSFVLDADGQRWAVDLGGDDYNLDGYFDRGEGGKRWQYYRLNTKSHNTLLIGGRNQKVEAKAPVVKFSSKPSLGLAVVDMTQAYEGALSVKRGMAILDRKRVLVQDEVKLRGPEEVRWGMLTRADLQLEGKRALLSQEGRQLEARILAPDGAVFEEVSTQPPLKGENPNTGSRMLAVRVSGTAEALTLAVLLGPPDLSRTAEAGPALKPLDKW